MQITIKNTINIREDWATTSGAYAFEDDQKGQVTITIQPLGGRPAIAAKAAVVGVPAQAAVVEDLTTTPPTYGKRAVAAIVAQPAVIAQPAVLACQGFKFVLWSGSAYTAACALNDGVGYGDADLEAAITAYLNNLETPSIGNL